MPMAVCTITQSGQVSLPKAFRDILGVKPNDQVAFLSDGERVEVVAVPENPLGLGTREEFLARVAKADAEYEEGKARPASDVSRNLRERHGLRSRDCAVL